MANSNSDRVRYLQVPNAFESIQHAINHANDGDVIQISRGEYHENLLIEKSISIVANEPNVILTPKQKDQPAIAVRGNNTELSIRGFIIRGDPKSPGNNKVGISLIEGSLMLRECEFSNWKINLDEAPLDTDFWENLLITGIHTANKANLLRIHNCKFYDCDNSASVFYAAGVEINGNTFINCDTALTLSKTRLISRNNSFANCGMCFQVGQDITIESSQDIYKDIYVFMGSGNSSGTIAFDDIIISTNSFILLALGETLSKRDSAGKWVLKIPKKQYRTNKDK